ncbi:MAG TPA: MFS transporter, partial [Polyangiaceae bacterium]
MKFGREQVITIAALIAVYAAFYLCRANVDSSFPLLTQAFGYDKEQLGRLASAGIFAYAVGKLVLGIATDWVGGFRMLLLVIAGSVAATLCLGRMSSLAWLMAFAVLNRFFQAGGWCSVVEISSRTFEATRYGTVMGLVSSSYELGNVLALLLCGTLIRAGLGWRSLFVANPILFTAVGAVSLFLLRAARRPPGYRGPDAAPAGTPEKAADPALRAGSVGDLFLKPTFWGALLLSFLLTFIRTGFLTWMPTFLAEAAGTTQAAAATGIIKSAVFPAAGMIGALAAGRVSDVYGPGRRGPVIILCLALLSVSVLALGHAGIHNSRIAIGAIACSGLFLLGPYSLVGGAVVLDIAANTRPALVSGMLDSAGYIGATLSGV